MVNAGFPQGTINAASICDVALIGGDQVAINAVDDAYGPTHFAGTDPHRVAFVDGDRVVRYGELEARTARLAAALAAMGVGADDRVAIMLDNSVEFFEAWAAVGRLDAAVVLVNWHLKRDELTYILGDSRAKVLIAAGGFESVAREAAASTGCRLVMAPDEYEAAIAGAPGPGTAHAAAVLDCTGLASPVFYTSGTTGRPKGVVHGTFRREAALAGQRGQVALWGWTGDDVYILSGPAYHAGPGGYVMAALFVGASTVIVHPDDRGRWDARAWLAAVARHHVTISFMTPAHFIRLLELPEADRQAADLSSLRVIVHGAAPCPVAVKQQILDWFPCPVWEIYGASEGGATRISSDEWRERPGSVGAPWPGIEVRILDEDGRPVGVGETGLVYVRPAGGARFHYHDDPDKTDAAWRDDAFTVGDVGHLDAGGYLYLTDRASDMVIRGGVNIYPREVEEVLYTHPAVTDCAVFGVPDERLGEQLKAVVELRTPTELGALADFVRARIADYKVPAQWEAIDELPRNPNGKVMKRQLRDAAWQDQERRIG